MPLATHSYKAKNKDEPGLEQKVQDLVDFIKSSKFGLMTTRVADSGLLVSRAMAVAAQVSHRKHEDNAFVPPTTAQYTPTCLDSVIVIVIITIVIIIIIIIINNHKPQEEPIIDQVFL